MCRKYETILYIVFLDQNIRYNLVLTRSNYWFVQSSGSRQWCGCGNCVLLPSAMRIIYTHTEYAAKLKHTYTNTHTPMTEHRGISIEQANCFYVLVQKPVSCCGFCCASLLKRTIAKMTPTPTFKATSDQSRLVQFGFRKIAKSACLYLFFQSLFILFYHRYILFFSIRHVIACVRSG